MLFVFPDPRADVQALLTSAAARWPAGTTINTSVPTALTAPYIQHDWDGTPSEQSNRQTAAIRVTAWTPVVRTSPTTTAKNPTDAINLAQLVRAFLLDSGSASTWRFTRGAGPAHGVNDDTGLPFCTFTVNAETRPTAVV